MPVFLVTTTAEKNRVGWYMSIIPFNLDQSVWENSDFILVSPVADEGLKATFENPRGSVEKLFPKESGEGGDTALRGSVRASEGFSAGKPEAAKPRGRNHQGFTAKGLPKENPEGALTLPLSPLWAPKALSWGDSYSTLPQGFSSVAQTTKFMRLTGKWC